MTFYKNLLLVDDDADDHEIFLEAVNEIDSSIKCTFLFDGEQALKMLKSGQDDLPDLIILDTNMPKINGKQMLAQLKEDERWKNIAVIMYSTFFSERDVEELRRLGAAFHLTKPSRFEDLRKELGFILHNKW